MFGPNGGACLTTPICDLVAYYRSPAGLPVKATPLLDEEFRVYFPFRSVSSQNLAALTLSTGGTGGVVTVQQRTPIVWAQIGDYIRVHRGDDAADAEQHELQHAGVRGRHADAHACSASSRSACARSRRRAAASCCSTRWRRARRSRTPRRAPTSTTPPTPYIYLRAVAASQVPLPIGDPTGKTLVLPVCETACADPPVINTTEPQPRDGAAPFRRGRHRPAAAPRPHLHVDAHRWPARHRVLERPQRERHAGQRRKRAGIGTAITRYIDTTGVHLLAAGSIAEKDPTAIFGADVDAAAGDLRIAHQPRVPVRVDQLVVGVSRAVRFHLLPRRHRHALRRPESAHLVPRRAGPHPARSLGGLGIDHGDPAPLLGSHPRDGDELLVLESFMAAPPFLATAQRPVASSST